MGLLFVVAIVSGVVVYGPVDAQARLRRSPARSQPRVRWLDLHNLLGIVLVMWALVVGFTGVINTWADLVIKIWQYGQLAEMRRSAQGPLRPGPICPPSKSRCDRAPRQPDMTPSSSRFRVHCSAARATTAVFLRGDTPVTSRLLKPVLVDAADGAFTDWRDLPWYVSTLLISQPLHFGDYGGMPLKIIWAVLDVFTIVVLASGLYLWFAAGGAPPARSHA